MLILCYLNLLASDSYGIWLVVYSLLNLVVNAAWEQGIDFLLIRFSLLAPHYHVPEGARYILFDQIQLSTVLPSRYSFRSIRADRTKHAQQTRCNQGN